MGRSWLPCFMHSGGTAALARRWGGAAGPATGTRQSGPPQPAGGGGDRVVSAHTTRPAATARCTAQPPLPVCTAALQRALLRHPSWPPYLRTLVRRTRQAPLAAPAAQRAGGDLDKEHACSAVWARHLHWWPAPQQQPCSVRQGCQTPIDMCSGHQCNPPRLNMSAASVQRSPISCSGAARNGQEGGARSAERVTSGSKWPPSVRAGSTQAGSASSVPCAPAIRTCVSDGGANCGAGSAGEHLGARQVGQAGASILINQHVAASRRGDGRYNCGSWRQRHLLANPGNAPACRHHKCNAHLLLRSPCRQFMRVCRKARPFTTSCASWRPLCQQESRRGAVRRRASVAQ